MLQFSHDPEVNTLYAYFTELEAGQAVESLEYPAHLLLDAEDLVVGLRLDLDDEVTLAQLELALDGEFGRLDMETGFLRILIPGAESNQHERLEQTAILDLDADEQILGVELALPEGFDPQRLARLAALMVALDEVPQAGEGPVVFGVDEEEEEEETAPDVPDAAEHAPLATFRSGFVALVGKPNVGKSTLLNTLLGQKVTIVSPRAQTTRVPVRGILSRPDAQVVFIDTPGIHQPSHKLGKFMVELAERTLPNADVICFMVDISQPPSQLDRSIAEQVQRARAHKLLLLNKVDIPPRRGTTYLEEYRSLGTWDMEMAISAQRGQGLSSLLDEIVARLPNGQPLYPNEQVTDQSEQQLAAELVREKVLYFIQQEVPHAVAVEVDEWETKEQAIYIRMTINVEKESQKGILIGAGGAMLKRIGSAARRDIERMVDKKVFLELWVKVRENWRDDLGAMGWLGYRMKDWR
ncbi:GTP-binding protein Era [Oscillochloris trichoides DG-6]|uniref:GTPase Era n=1 Tax=Oscillochloris trichoides DG-6 TaxID=765420 RepID=E1IAB0_9CHLR|nr:GTPase Era [Oscillochloris trichoides]EFO81864.1 GTP-binding protein Era [Oscillochloris trichoides DG-6]